MLMPLMQDHPRAGGLFRTDTGMAAADFEIPPPSVDEITTEVNSSDDTAVVNSSDDTAVVNSSDDTAVVNSSDEGMAGASMEIAECQTTVGMPTDKARSVDTKNLQTTASLLGDDARSVDTKNLQATPAGQTTASLLTDEERAAAGVFGAQTLDAVVTENLQPVPVSQTTVGLLTEDQHNPPPANTPCHVLMCMVFSGMCFMLAGTGFFWWTPLYRM